MSQEPRTSTLWWAIPSISLIVLAILAMLGGGGRERSSLPPPDSTYDASPNGGRAVFLMLQGLNYKVAQSRRVGAGKVRWILFPNSSNTNTDADDESETFGRKRRRRSSRAEDIDALNRWINDGGIVVLVDTSRDFAKLLELPVTAASSMEDIDNRANRSWPETDSQPAASIFKRGRGEVWIVHNADMFRNENIRKKQNALTICKLADVTSHDGAERIYFDEFFHGMRDRPGPLELLLQPPALWVTLEALLVLGILLWRHFPRFGPLIELGVVRRRSKEEFLEAMASLLQRKGAYTDAYRTVRVALILDLEQALSLPALTPIETLVSQAIRRRAGLDRDKTIAILSRTTPPPRADGFLRAIGELENIRREFFS
jgi:hypothetical protein